MSKLLLVLPFILMMLSPVSGTKDQGTEPASITNLSEYTVKTETYNDIIKNDPDNTEAYINRGTTRIIYEDNKGAVEDFTAAIRLDPENTEAYINRGKTKGELNNYPATIEDFTQAINFEPDNTRAYYIRVTAKSNSGDYIGAIEDLKKSNKLDPGLNKYIDSVNELIILFQN